MADYGLLGGIGEGLKQGILMYQRTKQLDRENQIQNLVSGVQTDENGNLQLNPEKQAQQQAQSLRAQSDIESYDPNSQKSINARNLAKQILAKASPGAEKGITDDMSANELNSENGLVGKAVQGGYGMQGNQLRASAMAGRIDEQKNNNASHAGNEFEHMLKPYKNVTNSLDRSESTLTNSSIPLTRATMNAAKQDYVNAIAQGGAATEGKVSREMDQTFQETWNGMLSKMGDNDDLRKSEPQMVSQLLSQVRAMKGEWQKAQSQQASDIADDYQSNTNPRVQDTIKTKLQRYAPDVYQQRYGQQGPANAPFSPQSGLIGNGPQGSPQAHPQDDAAIAWAKANPNDPRAAKILQANGVR